MSCHLIYYKNGAKMMRPISNREEYVGLRNNPANVEHTQLARMGILRLNARCCSFATLVCLPREAS